MFRARAIKYFLIAAGGAILLLLALLMPGSQNADLKVFDPGLHVLRAEVSIGTYHSLYGSRLRTEIHDLIYSHAPGRVSMRMDPSLVAETKTNSVAFVLHYRRDGLADRVTGELDDGSGHKLPLTTAGMFHIGHGSIGSTTKTTHGGLILMLDDPPTNGGNFELVLHPVGTNTVMAIWKVHLPVGAEAEALPLQK